MVWADLDNTLSVNLLLVIWYVIPLKYIEDAYRKKPAEMKYIRSSHVYFLSVFSSSFFFILWKGVVGSRSGQMAPTCRFALLCWIS